MTRSPIKHDEFLRKKMSQKFKNYITSSRCCTFNICITTVLKISAGYVYNQRSFKSYSVTNFSLKENVLAFKKGGRVRKENRFSFSPILTSLSGTQLSVEKNALCWRVREEILGKKGGEENMKENIKKPLLVSC